MNWDIWDGSWPPEDRLIRYVVEHVVFSEMQGASGLEPRLGYALDGFFKPNGGWLGDPLVEIGHIPKEGGLGHFEVHTCDEYSGIGLEHGVYAAEIVIDVMVNLFAIYASRFQKERHIVEQIMKRIPAYVERLRTLHIGYGDTWDNEHTFNKP